MSFDYLMGYIMSISMCMQNFITIFHSVQEIGPFSLFQNLELGKAWTNEKCHFAISWARSCYYQSLCKSLSKYSIQFMRLFQNLSLVNASANPKWHLTISWATSCQYQCVCKILSKYSERFKSYRHFSWTGRRQNLHKHAGVKIFTNCPVTKSKCLIIRHSVKFNFKFQLTFLGLCNILDNTFCTRCTVHDSTEQLLSVGYCEVTEGKYRYLVHDHPCCTRYRLLAKKFRTTVIPHYNDHLYKGNFDFRRNFFGNGPYLMKIYYIITEFTLSNTDGDSRWRNAFLTHFLFIKMTEKKLSNKLFTCKNFQLAINCYVHCHKWLTGKSKETSCAMTMLLPVKVVVHRLMF